MPTNEMAVLSQNIFSDQSTFDLASRMSTALAKSTIVPKEYQGNASNCIVALEMASRLGTSPMMVMQNLYVVNGRPAWSSQYIIAMINSSKKYKTEIQFELTGKGDSLACHAWAIGHDNRRVIGPTITMEMARLEGWVGKSGSKWKTIPEVMIRYRAASFFGRMYCPDLVMGIYSREEVIELGENDFAVIEEAQGDIRQSANKSALEIDPATGEVECVSVKGEEHQKKPPESEPDPPDDLP